MAKLFGDVIWRWRALTMPVVTVCSRPNGLPIAIDAVADFQLRRVGELERLEHGRRRIDVDDGDVG